MFAKKRPPGQPRRAHQPRPSPRSNAVFSYHANRSVREGGQYRDAGWEQEEVSRKGRRTAWRRRLPSMATLLLIALVAAFCLRLNSNAKVESVGLEGGQLFLRDKNVYVKAAQGAFSSLANSNKLTVNTGKISADLRRQFPELQVVSVSLPVLGNRPIVYVQPAPPRLILVAKNGMYVLDGNGRALIAGNQVAKLNELGVPIVSDQSGLSFQTGDIALPRDTVDFIGEVAGQLKAKGIALTSLTLPPGTNELHVRIQGAGYAVKYNLHGDAREEAGTFIATKARLEAERKTPREYIDVRVENKAYYR